MISDDRKMLRRWIAGAVVLLAVLHPDCWWWDDGTLVFGFMPIGLAYHVGYSLAAGLTWWIVVKFAWPDHIEAWADDAAASQEQARGGDR